MQSKKMLRYLFAILFLFSFNIVHAIEIVPAQPDTTVEIEIIDSLPIKFHSYVQVAFGLSQRADESNLIDHSTMFHGKIYYHLSNKLSTKLGLGYSSPNMFKSNTFNSIGFRNFSFELGFRWNIFSRGVSFYHENGIEYNHYFEPQSTIWEQRIGMNFKFGINFRINHLFLLDIGVGQTFNNGSFSKTKNIDSSVSPIGLKDDHFFNEVFNPLTVQVLLFKTL